MALEDRIRVIGARLLVKEERLAKENEAGIILPGREKQQTNKGIVLKVGDGSMLADGTKVPINISVGETVIYSSFAGSPIKEKEDDPDNYLILNERDILCVVES